MKIVTNKAKCKLCGDIIISNLINEYTYCSCKAIGVSGGHESIMRLGHHNHIIELSEKEYSE